MICENVTRPVCHISLAGSSNPCRTAPSGVRRQPPGLAVGVGVGSAVTVEFAVGTSVDTEPSLGVGVGGPSVELGQVLPGGTWQSSGATIRGSVADTAMRESATATSASGFPPVIGPESWKLSPSARQIKLP
jgi:hypothetical protein